MPKTTFASLLEKYLANQLSTEELKCLLTYFEEGEAQKSKEFDDLYARLKKEVTFNEEQKKRVFNNIKDRMAEAPDGKKKTKRNWRPWMRAVAAAVLLFLGLYWLTLNPRSDKDYSQINLASQISLRPNLAPLVYVNKSWFSGNQKLDSLEFDQLGLHVSEEGTLMFSEVENQAYQGKMVTIKCERGQTVALSLSDQTKVWLNSKSEIQFPLEFNEGSREVVLQGEAYFEVAKNANKPFRVHAEENIIEVLGTKFNVTSNNKNHETVTSLLEGKVRVSNPKTSQVLQPMDQAIQNNNTQNTQLTRFSEEEILGWKNGLFIFDDVSIEELLGQIEEWYDLKEVVIQASNKAKFSGIFKRSRNLETLLSSLEELSAYHFEIKKGGLYVMNK